MYAQESQLWVIAHRGGVVDSTLEENSLDGLEEAIKRGYTHVEIDVRMTADGALVCYHNHNFRKETNIKGKINKLTLARIQQALPHLPTFDAFCQKCAGRIGLMLDIKGCSNKQITRYCQQIDSTLNQYNLQDNALILINQFTLNNQIPISKYFLGKAKISWRKSLNLAHQKAKKDPRFAQNYYVFNHNKDFTPSIIQGFQKLGLKVIVSVNTGHFASEPLKNGALIIKKMLSCKVDGFQIDSCYDYLLF